MSKTDAPDMRLVTFKVGVMGPGEQPGPAMYEVVFYVQADSNEDAVLRVGRALERLAAEQAVLEKKTK
jgi:hypothetical protein